MQSQIEKVLCGAGANFKKFDNDTKQHLHSCVLRYAFRVITSKQLTIELKDVSKDFDPRTIRKNIMHNGKLLKNSKLFCYASAKFPNVLREMFDVTPDDEVIIRHQLETDPKLRKKLKNYIKQGYRPLTIQKMDNLIVDVIKEVEVYTSKFVNKKHRFIFDSEGEEFSSIKQELFWWSIYAIYRQYPQIDSFEHAVNIAKCALRNRGNNIIYEKTAQCRQRLIKNKDGTFSSKHVPMHSLLTTSGTPEEIVQFNYLAVDIGGNSAEGKSPETLHDNLDLRLSLKLLHRNLPTRMKLLLKLWSGVFDEPFSTWLGQPNDEWLEEVDRTEYLIKCAEFVGIEKKVAFSFYRRLQARFIDYAPSPIAEKLIPKLEGIPL